CSSLLKDLQMRVPLNRFRFEVLLLTLMQKGLVQFFVVNKSIERRTLAHNNIDEEEVSLLSKARYLSEKETSQLAISIVILAIFLITLSLVMPNVVNELFMHLASFARI